MIVFPRVRWYERARIMRLGVRFAIALPVAGATACDSAAPTEFVGPADGASAASVAPSAILASAHDNGVAIAWLRLSFDLTRDEFLYPPVAARAYAYLGVALWESVAPGVTGGRSLAGQLNGLAALPLPGHDLHWPTVANAALASIMPSFYASARSRQAIRQMEHTFQDRFRREIPHAQFGRSLAHGQRVDAAIEKWSRNDGYDRFHDCPHSAVTGPGQWEPTPPAFEDPIEPCWGQLRPLVLISPGECAPRTHPPYSEHPGSVFYQEAVEVYETVNNVTAEQRTIALYWADLAGETATPAGHSLSITAQVLEQLDASLDMAAEAFARVGIGESDAFISCWASKYHYNLLRPVTYINAIIDADWEPVLETPPFPAYTSGHSNDAGASSTILTALFGAGFAFTDHTNVGLGFEPRSFPSFLAAASESAISRLYGGIHYRSDIEEGLAQGACVGRAVNALVFRTS
ncbi:MAG: vanadium-dependent haloperoxidase [Gemmatimonadetes bacterium]|nr:vanadium-dependent haloperoxidase [Gemmatimonadota bacterium]